MATFVADAITFNTTAGNKTVAITPAVGDLLIVIAGNSGTTTDPTITDDRGGTYTRIAAADATKNASADEMHFYVRDQLCQLAVSHTLTMNVGGAGTGGGAWVARVAGMAKAGANAVRQAAKQDNQAGSTTPTATFTIPILTESFCVFAVMNGATTATITEPSGFVERRDTGYNTPATGIEIATRDSGQTGLTIAAQSATTVYCTLAVELDTATPTSYGSGRYEHPGQPQEVMRRRLPFPAQDFTNTSVSGPVTETPTFGGAVASGRTPSPTVAVANAGSIAGGAGPSANAVIAQAGSPASGFAPGANATVAQGSSTGSGRTPAPQVTPSLGSALGQGTGPVAIVSVTSQGATASGNPPTAVETVSFGGATASGTAPSPQVILTPGGALGQGVQPTANATATPTQGQGLASGNPPSPQAILTPGSSLGQGQGPGADVTPGQGSGSGTGTGPVASVSVSPGGAVTDVSLPEELSSDDFNRADNPTLGAPWDSDGNLGEFTIDGNELEPDGVGVEFARVYLGAALPDDQYAEITLTSLVAYAVVNGGAGLGLTLRHSQDAFLFWSNYYKVTFSTGASGNIDVSRYDNGSYNHLANFTASISDGDTVRFEAVGDELSVYINGALIGSANDATYSSGYAGIGYSAGNTIPRGDDWSAGAVGAAPVITAVVSVSPGGAIATGFTPTDSSGTAETPTFGGATASGNSPNPTIATVSQGATGSGTGPTTATDLTAQGAIGQGAAPGTSSTPGQGGSSGNGSGPVAVVTVTSQGATASGNSPFPTVGVSIGGSTAGGNAPSEFYFEVPGRGGATASGNAPGANATSAIGASTASGNTPSPQAILAPGGSTGQGTGPGTSSTPGQGGSSGDGTGPTAVVGVTPGGAITNVGLPQTLDTDDFNRADGTLTTPWESTSGSPAPFKIDGNQVTPDNSAAESTMVFLGTPLPDDQYAEITSTLTGHSALNSFALGMGLSLRVTQDAFLFYSKGYHVNWYIGGTGNVCFFRTDPTIVNIGFATVTIADGDRIRFEAVGDELRFYVNGVLEASFTDATYPSGYSGLKYEPGATPVPKYDDFEVGAVGAPPVITAVVGVSPGGAVTGGNAPSAPLQESPVFGGGIAGGNSPSSEASVDLGGSATSSGGVNVYVTLGPSGAIAGYFPPTEIGVTPPAPTGPTPGSGGAKRVQSIHNRIEPDRRIRDEEEEEALLLISLSLE